MLCPVAEISSIGGGVEEYRRSQKGSGLYLALERFLRRIHAILSFSLLHHHRTSKITDNTGGHTSTTNIRVSFLEPTSIWGSHDV